METYQFTHAGRRTYIEAATMFEAMLIFMVKHEGSSLEHLSELTIVKLV